MKSPFMKHMIFNKTSPAERKYQITFRCYYERQDVYTRYVRELPLEDIQRWIESYEITHLDCRSISFGV